MSNSTKYELLYGRKVITPRLYLNLPSSEQCKAQIEWYKTARCICDCGSEVSLKSHWAHKKSKKHKEYVMVNHNNDNEAITNIETLTKLKIEDDKCYGCGYSDWRCRCGGGYDSD